MVGQYRYGEASEDVHGIADAVAEALAGQRWRLMGARTQTEARAYFISTVRRELGITFVIAMARHRLQREPFVGMSPAAVRAMRDARGQAVRRHHRGRHYPTSGCTTSIGTRPRGDVGRCWRPGRECV